MSAEQPRATELEAISGRSGVALSAPFAKPTAGSPRRQCLGGLRRTSRPRVIANVGASSSFPDLAVGTAANVGVPTSPPVLDVVAAANVGATTSLAQTTPHTSQKSDVEVDMGVGCGDLVPGITTEILPTLSYIQSLQASSLLPRGHDNVVFLLDPSLLLTLTLTLTLTQTLTLLTLLILTDRIVSVTICHYRNCRTSDPSEQWTIPKLLPNFIRTFPKGFNYFKVKRKFWKWSKNWEKLWQKFRNFSHLRG